MFNMMKLAISGTPLQHLRSSREHLKNWGRTSCVCSPRTRWVRPHNRGSLKHLSIHLAVKSHHLVQGEGRAWRGFGKTTSPCKSGVLKSNVRLEKCWMTLIVNDLVLLKAQVLPSSLMVFLCRSWFWWIQRCRACGQVGDPRLMEDKVEILPLINLIDIGNEFNPKIKTNVTKYQFKEAM